MRECRVCKVSKEESEYYANGASLMVRCKACHRADMARRRDQSPVTIVRPLNIRLRRASAGGPSKRCGCCGETKGDGEFTRDRYEPDGRSWACRGCQSWRRTIATYAARRSDVTAPGLLDNCDRAERRAELARLGGLPTVRAFRRRIEAARRAKSILCGASIPDDVLSSLLSRSERRS